MGPAEASRELVLAEVLKLQENPAAGSPPAASASFVIRVRD